MRCLYFRRVCMWNRTGHCRNSLHFSSLLLSYLDLLYMQSVPQACSLFGINLPRCCQLFTSRCWQWCGFSTKASYYQKEVKDRAGGGDAIGNSSIVFQHQSESKSKSKDVNVSLTMKSECRDSLMAFSHKTGLVCVWFTKCWRTADQKKYWGLWIRDVQDLTVKYCWTCKMTP